MQQRLEERSCVGILRAASRNKYFFCRTARQMEVSTWPPRREPDGCCLAGIAVVLPKKRSARACKNSHGGKSRNPKAPVTKNAARHPKRRVIAATTGGATRLPTLKPQSRMPTALARFEVGNQSETPRMAVG